MAPAEGVDYEEIDAKDPDTLTEVEKIALLGRPRLGDVTKLQIRIKESKEFKVNISCRDGRSALRYKSVVLFKTRLILHSFYYIHQRFIILISFSELCGQDDATFKRFNDDRCYLMEGPIPGIIHRSGW